MNPTVANDPEVRLAWEDRVDPAQWEVYRRVVQEARRAGVRFAFGGAFATAVYTGKLRNTKDFDFYILPEDRQAMIGAVARAGLQDYYERLPYDRKWIHRSSSGDVIVDVIWAMANLRAWVDAHWLTAGPEVTMHAERIRAIPIEELIWSKLYVLQRERSDWGDVLNLIDARADTIDWDRLITRLADDAPLLTGALALFGWLAPDRARDILEPVWSRLGLARPERTPDPEVTRRRAALLDSRPWFRDRDQ